MAATDGVESSFVSVASKSGIPTIALGMLGSGQFSLSAMEKTGCLTGDSMLNAVITSATCVVEEKLVSLYATFEIFL